MFGVPGSSKTTGLVLPNAAEWAGPLVVTTTKAADLDVIRARRQAIGPVWAIAPAGIPGRAGDHWSPVAYCTDAKAADRMAAWLAEASASGGDKRAAAWVDQAKSVLLAAQLSGGGISDMRRWISLGKDAVDHVRAVLLSHGFDDVADDYASPWLRLHEDGVGSIQFSLNVLARVFADEEVRETCSRSDFTFEEWLDGNGTICVIASEADADRFAPLISSLIAGAIHAAEARYNSTGKPIDPSVGILVDEAATCSATRGCPTSSPPAGAWASSSSPSGTTSPSSANPWAPRRPTPSCPRAACACCCPAAATWRPCATSPASTGAPRS